MHKNNPRPMGWVVFVPGWCIALALQGVLAQPHSPSVSDLIDSVKAQREAALGFDSRKAPSDLGAKVRSHTPANPLLWSISGLNDNLSAVLVIGQRVYQVDNASLPQQVGGWQVERLDANSIWLSRAGRRMKLPAPSSASTAHAFVHALQAAKSPTEESGTPRRSPQAESLWPGLGLTAAQSLAARLPAMSGSVSTQAPPPVPTLPGLGAPTAEGVGP